MTRLPVALKEEAKLMVLRVLDDPAFSRTLLDVSRDWLIREVAILGLQEEEVRSLLTIREFGGSVSYALRLVNEGFTVDDVCGIYRVRQELTDVLPPISNKCEKPFIPSLCKIGELVRCFSEADPDNDSLAVIILDLHERIQKKRGYRWVKTVNQTIDILCGIKRAFPDTCCTLEGAISWIDRKEAVQCGVMPEEGEEDASDSGEDESEVEHD
jgi:hypothetical protein